VLYLLSLAQNLQETIVIIPVIQSNFSIGTVRVETLVTHLIPQELPMENNIVTLPVLEVLSTGMHHA